MPDKLLLREDFFRWFAVWPPEKIEEFIAGYPHELRAVIISAGIRLYDVDAVVTDTVLKLQEIADQYDPDERLWPWVRRTAFNAARSFRNTDSRRFRKMKPLLDDPAAAIQRVEEDEARVAAITKRLMDIAVANNWQFDGETLKLGIFALNTHLKSAKVALLFDVPVNKVYQAKHRVGEKLAQHFNGIITGDQLREALDQA